MRVLIADDMPHVGKRLERLIRRIPGVRTVNYCKTTDEAILGLMELQPDLLILDHRLQDETGCEILRKLPQYSPHTQVCIYSTLLSDIDRSSYHVQEIRGFYEKSADLDRMLAQIELEAEAGGRAALAT